MEKLTNQFHNAVGNIYLLWEAVQQFLHSFPSSFSSVLIQKRLKKEKRSKRKLQEALEEEVKLRDQAEHSLLHTANSHIGAQTEAFFLFVC